MYLLLMTTVITSHTLQWRLDVMVVQWLKLIVCEVSIDHLQKLFISKGMNL